MQDVKTKGGNFYEKQQKSNCNRPRKQEYKNGNFLTRANLELQYPEFECVDKRLLNIRFLTSAKKLESTLSDSIWEKVIL